MIPDWVKTYIGTPFEVCNCWQLVCRVYRDQLDIVLPDLENSYRDPKDRLAIAALYERELKRCWQPTREAALFTAVVFLIRGQPWHVGLVIDAENEFMLHTFEHIDCVLERYSLSVWRRRIEGFYNYVA